MARRLLFVVVLQLFLNCTFANSDENGKFSLDERLERENGNASALGTVGIKEVKRQRTPVEARKKRTDEELSAEEILDDVAEALKLAGIHEIDKRRSERRQHRAKKPPTTPPTTVVK